MPESAIFAIREILSIAVVGVTIGIVAYSPVFRALGNLIMHGRTPKPGIPADAARVDELQSDVAFLSRQLEEMSQRVEFTERMLAQARERGQLNGSRS